MTVSQLATLAVALLALQGTPGGRPEVGIAEGRVTRADTGDPISGVQVTLQSGRSRPYTTLTDAAGHFILEDVPANDYNVTLRHEGYVLPDQRGNLARISVGTLFLTTSRTLHFSMLPVASISGTIADATGMPARNVPIVALRIGYRDGRPFYSEAAIVRTDASGTYKVTGLASGGYAIRAEPDGLLPTYFPGVVDAASVKEIPLRSGNEVKGIAFTLQTAVGARIFGKVSTASLNVPVQVPSRYFLLPTDRPSALAAPLTSYRNWASAANQLKGEFELRGIMPGNYDLYPVITGQVGYTAKVHITAGTADIHDVAVLIEPGVTVSGRLVSQDGPLQVGRLQITLQFKNNAAADFLSQVVRIQPPDRDGVFTMLNVPEGSYQIIVSQPERGYVADIREGAVSIFDAGLGVSNRPPAQIQIVLGRNGAAIAGYVRTSTQPAGDVTVTLVPEAARRGNSALYKTTKTANGTGRFVFNEVAPGAYKLFSWENAPPGAETSPEFIEKYEDRGAPVRVEARSDGRGPSIDNLQVQLIQQQQP